MTYTAFINIYNDHNITVSYSIKKNEYILLLHFNTAS